MSGCGFFRGEACCPPTGGWVLTVVPVQTMNKSLISIAAICLFAVPCVGEAGFISLNPDPPFAVDFAVSSDIDSATASLPVDSEPPQPPFPRRFDGLVIDPSHSAGLSGQTPTGGSNSSLTLAIPVDRLATQPPLLSWRLGEVSPLLSGPDLEGVSPVPRSKSLLRG